jgi:MscS family membrane protein
MLREFLRAVDRNDYVSAARYMQLSRDEQGHPELLARDIRELLDCCFDQPLATISDADTGALDDGLPLDQERVGPLKIGDHHADILLVRVDHPPGGKIWLISSQTLEEIPALHALITESRVERLMPQSLQRHVLFGLSLAHWLVWLGSFLAPLLCFTLLAQAIIFLIGKVPWNEEKRSFVLNVCEQIKWPVVQILAIAVVLVSLPRLGFPLRFRIVNQRLGAVAVVILTTSILRRLVTIFFDRTRAELLRRDRTHPASLLLLGERLLKVLLAIAAGFAILTAAGVDTRTALTGLGIGGIAVAFGAQKTVENLLGGILLISDRAIAIGDVCSISDRMGTIEDITLRSVRMRTLEQTLLSIPAGMLSQANIENFRTRTKILMTSTARLQYSASAAQISAVRDGIYNLLIQDVRVEGSTARVNLTDFGQWAIELQIWAYLLTPDIMKFHQIRQDILLQIAHIIETEGCRFALPSQTIYTPAGTPQPGREATLPK